MRTRLCSNEKGYCEEKKGCVNNLCRGKRLNNISMLDFDRFYLSTVMWNSFLILGPAGAAKAQSLVETFLREFHSSEFPEKKPTGTNL